MSVVFKGAIGTPKSTPILFVHGAWHGAWCWEKYFMPYFSKMGYNTHAINLSMHDKPGSIKNINQLRIADYVNDLLNVVKDLKQSPIIIGHSLGGLVLQKYLENHTCQKAIFLASIPPSGTLRLSIKLLFTNRFTILSMVTLDLFKIVNNIDRIRWLFFSEDAPKKDVEFCMENICSESFFAYLDMLFPRVSVPANFQIPTLALAAKNDRFFSLKENERIAKQYRGDTKVIPNVAHDMMLDTNWQDAAKGILTWIEKDLVVPKEKKEQEDSILPQKLITNTEDLKQMEKKSIINVKKIKK